MADDDPGIDWSSASVDDGRLTVAFGGRQSSEWIERVQDVLERLGRPSRRWGAIEVGKKRLRVDAVTPGAEADLRHFLERAVLQANADVPPEETEGEQTERSRADQEMTDTFRSFADG
jgi:hypothetical protein